MPVDWRQLGRSTGVVRLAGRTRTMFKRMRRSKGRPPDDPSKDGLIARFQSAPKPMDLVPPTILELLDLNSLERLVAACRLAVVGEFSAGKSSLVNLVLGADLLPRGLLPTTRRPTLI